MCSWYMVKVASASIFRVITIKTNFKKISLTTHFTIFSQFFLKLKKITPKYHKQPKHQFRN